MKSSIRALDSRLVPTTLKDGRMVPSISHSVYDLDNRVKLIHVVHTIHKRHSPQKELLECPTIGHFDSDLDRHLAPDFGRTLDFNTIRGSIVHVLMLKKR